MCRGCDLAARLIEARAVGGVIAARDAAFVRDTERGTFAALRRIGAGCFPAYELPGIDLAVASMTAVKMVDQLERVQLGPRRRKRR